LANFEIISTARPAVDLEIPGSLAAHIRLVAPDAVVNAAAYTDVDRAEDEPDHAFRINADAAGEAAAAAREIGASIVHISTDYVFDGAGSVPYREDAPTHPVGVYGKSKLAGEEQVRAANPQSLIMRTAWLYSPFGRNFVRTMLRLASERPEIAVVDDQRGTPTSALDLADAILHAVGPTILPAAAAHVAGPSSPLRSSTPAVTPEGRARSCGRLQPRTFRQKPGARRIRRSIPRVSRMHLRFRSRTGAFPCRPWWFDCWTETCGSSR
jgi:dTDP-4-dehydrorhamnose reductase